MALTDQEVTDGRARPASKSTRNGRSVKRVAAERRRHSAQLAMNTCFASRADSAELATRLDAGEPLAKEKLSNALSICHCVDDSIGPTSNLRVNFVTPQLLVLLLHHSVLPHAHMTSDAKPTKNSMWTTWRMNCSMRSLTARTHCTRIIPCLILASEN